MNDTTEELEIKVPKYIPIIYEQKEDIQIQDMRFTPVTIKLMHTGSNYNGSIFNKSVVEKALPSLANTPILCFIEKDEESGEIDFSDHRYIVKKVNGKYEYEYIGTAIGTIGESHADSARWVYEECSDGVDREFLVVDGLIWNKWSNPLEIFERADGVKSQSMELEVSSVEGYENSDGYFVFTSFQFFGACCLGGSRNLPAMIDSTIEVNFTLDSFKSDIQEKMEMYKHYMNQQQNQSDNLKDNSEAVFIRGSAG